MRLNRKEESKMVVDRQVVLVKIKKGILIYTNVLTRIVKIPTISTSTSTRKENL